MKVERYQNLGFGAVLVSLRSSGIAESTSKTQTIIDIFAKLQGSTKAMVEPNKAIVKFEAAPETEKAANDYLGNMQKILKEKLAITEHKLAIFNPEKEWNKLVSWLKDTNSK